MPAAVVESPLLLSYELDDDEVVVQEKSDFNKVIVGNDDVKAFNFFLTGKEDLNDSKEDLKEDPIVRGITSYRMPLNVDPTS